MSFVAVDYDIGSSHVIPMSGMGTDWGAIIPFGYMPGSTFPALKYDANWDEFCDVQFWNNHDFIGVDNNIFTIQNKEAASVVKKYYR